MSASPSQPQRKVSPQWLLAQKQAGQSVAWLTAYDYTTAKLLDEAGVPVLLVGDSLAMTVLGHPNTLSVTVEEMLHHTKAVAKAAQRAMVVADAPFMSYHLSVEQGLATLGRLMQEGHADAVKVEGASPLTLQLVERATQAGIPVVGHLGLTPQHVKALGGFKRQAQSVAAATQLLHQAQALQAAGCFALVLELVPKEVAATVSEQLHIPTVGIGAGPHCNAQVLVVDDVLGRYDGLAPSFVRQYMAGAALTQQAAKAFVADVASGAFPHAERESFGLPPEALEAWRQA